MTNTPPTDDAIRQAGGRGRQHLTPPPAPPPDPAPAAGGPDEVPGPPAYVDLTDEELAIALSDKATRREALSDPAVKVRLARQDPDIRAELERWEEWAQAAEDRAAAKLEGLAAGMARPAPLPGGGAAPTYQSTRVSPDRMLRAAARKARNEGTGDRDAGRLVDSEGTGAATFRTTL